MPSQSRSALIAAVVKAIEAIAAKSNLDTETKRLDQQYRRRPATERAFSVS
jgi:hypothetical protein